MREGDDNTNFYHNFANGRRVINTILNLTNEQGTEVDTCKDAEGMGLVRWEGSIREGVERDIQVTGNYERSIIELGCFKSDESGAITSESSLLNGKCTLLLDGLPRMDIPSRGSFE